jgi:AAHS family 4-hydroxybenzoate transporter-like MFS transporter
VLAKQPLLLTPEQIRWLAVAPILLVVVGAYTASAISDRVSRKTVMQFGVVVSTFFTLLIPLAQSGTQLIIIRVLTGIGLGCHHPSPLP